ncbi:MAG: hypothetical protein WCY88_16775 [Spongiibacteraceae bacterium]
MKKTIARNFNYLRLAAFLLLLICSRQSLALNAPAALVPAGLNPGDTFYIIFVSSGTITGDQVSANYLTFATVQAAAGAATGTDLVAGWVPLFAHNDGTITINTAFAADVTRPIYDVAGLKMGDNKADLLDGTFDGELVKTQIGTTLGTIIINTGLDAVGASSTPLQSAGGLVNATQTTTTDNFGFYEGQAGSASAQPMMILSPLLTVPSAVTASAGLGW